MTPSKAPVVLTPMIQKAVTAGIPVIAYNAGDRDWQASGAMSFYGEPEVMAGEVAGAVGTVAVVPGRLLGIDGRGGRDDRRRILRDPRVHGARAAGRARRDDPSQSAADEAAVGVAVADGAGT